MSIPFCDLREYLRLEAVAFGMNDPRRSLT
jgi:hypothetical protein